MQVAAYVVCALILALNILSVVLGWWVSPYFYWGLLPFGPLLALGVWDVVQWVGRSGQRWSK